MSTPRLQFEDLTDDIHYTIFKYLSLYDLYYSFFSLNSRYDNLIKRITPTKIHTKWLDHDMDQSGILISRYWVWNDKFLYFMMPKLQKNQSNAVKWLFFEEDLIDKFEQQLDRRVIQIVKQYQVKSNAPGLLVTKPNYYFCSNAGDLLQLEQWIKENYPEQYEVIHNFGPRHHLPKRLDHYDGKYMEIKQALEKIQSLERLKRRNMIYQRAQEIWSELRRLKYMNVLDLVIDE